MARGMNNLQANVCLLAVTMLVVRGHHLLRHTRRRDHAHSDA